MKILMVEDHDLFAHNVISTFLTAHDVTLVAAIAVAKERLRSEAFDLLLVDFDLEDGKGDELVRWARVERIDTPIIAISSHEHGNAMLKASGANAICSKMEFGTIADVIESTTSDGISP